MAEYLRREDVVALINDAREKGESDLRQVRAWIEFVPADPVAEAAVALADYVCQEGHRPLNPVGEGLRNRYRAAVAGRPS